MNAAANYPEMGQLFAVYLNQDYEHWGDSIESIVNCYKQDSQPGQIQSLAEEIQRFKDSHAENLDAAFAAAYGFDFDPALWALTTSAFLNKLLLQLSVPGAPGSSPHH